MAEVYYTKKEYNEMVRKFERKIKSLETQNTKLTNKLKEVTADYNALLETATEA